MLDAMSSVVSAVLVISSSPCWICARSSSPSPGAGAPVEFRQCPAEVLVGAVEQARGGREIVGAGGNKHGLLHRAVGGIEIGSGGLPAMPGNRGDHARGADLQLFVVGPEIDHVAVMHMAELDGHQRRH